MGTLKATEKFPGVKSFTVEDERAGKKFNRTVNVSAGALVDEKDLSDEFREKYKAFLVPASDEESKTAEANTEARKAAEKKAADKKTMKELEVKGGGKS